MHANNRHVMIVDDEALMRTLLHDFFVSQGYRVACYSTGKGALENLIAAKVPFSALLADIRMKPMNGMELLVQVKTQFPQLPVVLFTSAGTPDERDLALSQGALHYMTKPFSLTELRSIVDSAIAPKPPFKK